MGVAGLLDLNTDVDHPGVPFARAADCLALVEAVDSRHLRLMLDLYHAQIGLEAWASGVPELALERFRDAFTL